MGGKDVDREKRLADKCYVHLMKIVRKHIGSRATLIRKGQHLLRF